MRSTPPRLQHRRRRIDEGVAEAPILAPAVVERRVHDHEVEVGRTPGAAAQIVLKEVARGVVEVALGRLDGAAVDVDQGELRHRRRRQNGTASTPDAAAEIGAGAGCQPGPGHQAAALPGSIRSQQNTPGCDHRPSAGTRCRPPAAIAASRPDGAAGRAQRQMR